MTPPLRLGIVDDRPLAAEAIRRVVSQVPAYTVAWTATDGEQAVRRATQDPPDLILMDLLMPGVNGVEATRRIMAACPCPILVVTATVSGNFTLVFDAMAAGALDAVATPVLGSDGHLQGGDALLAKIAQIGKKLTPARKSTSSGSYHVPTGSGEPPLVVIGASTGGPQAIGDLLAQLPAGFPGAVLITQHITPDFTVGLADWLTKRSKFPVRVASSGEKPTAGVALLAGRDDHLVIQADGRLLYTPHPTDTPFRPNVDALFGSVAAHVATPNWAVLLTGMGRDGAEGLLKLRHKKWTTYAQTADTCAVNGMPDAAVKLGAAEHILSPAEIGRHLAARIGPPRR